jgi:hypothetical protein
MNTFKLQVPMDPAVRDGLEKRATELGFDSAQAYIRFWAKAEVDGRKINLNVDDWGKPSLAATTRLDTLANEARQGVNVSEPYYTAEEFMKDL